MTDNNKETEIHYPLDHSVENELLKTEGNEGTHNVSIRHRLRWLMDKAPSDATATFFIKPVKNGFKGLLKIHSTQRRFVAGGEASSLSELMDRISSEIRGQLHNWRQVRFSDA
jgi:hypothetical protein